MKSLVRSKAAGFLLLGLGLGIGGASLVLASGAPESSRGTYLLGAVIVVGALTVARRP